MAKKVTITVVEGPDKGQTRTFTSGTLRVGRSKSDIVLSDKKVSGKHCEFGTDGEKVWIEDLQSTNGTFIGSKKITDKVFLKNLDQVIVGLSHISVAIVDELKSFKEMNSTGSIPGDFDMDDISGVDDQMVGLLEDSELSVGFTNTKKSGEKEATKTESVKSGKSKSKPMPEVKLPADDAVYRETGIHRIENLIKDELDTFSKWDHPAGGANEKVSSIPKIKVVLQPRRGPDGIGPVECTKAATSFGRKDVDVRLNDLDCSRKHASVEIVGGNKAFVRDLASTNGTYLNGKKISYQELKTGDLIQIGTTIFEVTIEGGS